MHPSYGDSSPSFMPCNCRTTPLFSFDCLSVCRSVWQSRMDFTGLSNVPFSRRTDRGAYAILLMMKRYVPLLLDTLAILALAVWLGGLAFAWQAWLPVVHVDPAGKLPVAFT